jgi:hypothetical protein
VARQLGDIVKTTAGALALGAIFFALTNWASYFLRSDGYARPGVADGIRRCGFPLVFWEEGGWTNLHDYYLYPILADMLVALVVGVIALALIRKYL